MTIQIVLLFLIVGAAVVLFSWDRLPADVTALGIFLTLVLARLLPPGRAFASFGSDTVAMIFGLLVLTAALVQTGVVDMLGRVILRFAGVDHNRLLLTIMIVVAALSAFMSNTATAALFVPITLGVARRAHVGAPKLLMPLAFASILASSVTLVSSSTNIVISGVMAQYAMEPLGMFELTRVGVPIALLGLAYMFFIAPKLIPNRAPPDEDTRAFGIRPYLVEVLVAPGSPLVGKTLIESGLGRDMDLTVLRVLRDHNHYLAPKAALRLQEGDELLVKGHHNDILKIKDAVGIDLKADVTLSDPRLQSQDMRLVEAILLPPSSLIGHTLKEAEFRQRFGLQVLGINRRGKNIYRKLSQIALQIGDQLLLQGAPSDMDRLDRERVLHIVSTIEDRRPNRQRAPAAIAIFAVALALAALNVLPLAVAVILGALAAFVWRCIAPDEAYRAIEWKAIVVIGCMLAMGQAMEHTGAAAFLASQIVTVAGQLAPIWLLSAFFVLTLILTQPMSNQAAAVVVLPVALQTAMQLGLNPRTFAVMIALGASCSFITPLEPACLIVYGPGRYRFMDFVRVGLPLTALVYLLSIVLTPLFWPL